MEAVVELAATATDAAAGQAAEDEAGLEMLDQMHGRVVAADALVDCGSLTGSPAEGQDALEGEVAVPTEVVDAAASYAASYAAAEEGDEDTDDTVGSCLDVHSEPSAAGEACTESAAAHWDP